MFPPPPQPSPSPPGAPPPLCAHASAAAAARAAAAPRTGSIVVTLGATAFTTLLDARPGRPVRPGRRCPLRRCACSCAARCGCDCSVRLGRDSHRTAWRTVALPTVVRCCQASRWCLLQLVTARSANAKTCRERCCQAARSRHLSVLHKRALARTTKADAIQRALGALVELDCNVNSSDWQQRQAAPRRSVPAQRPQAGEGGWLQSWGTSLATPVRSRDTCRSRTSVRRALRCAAGALHRSMPACLSTG